MGASHTHRMRVAYGDCDPSGVVFNPNYLVFYDVALTEFWREYAGGYGAMMEEGVDLQVVEATLRYKVPARPSSQTGHRGADGQVRCRLGMGERQTCARGRTVPGRRVRW